MDRREGSIRHHGRRLAYESYGGGERTLVLVHGLLMNRRMYDHLAPEMASRGLHVIAVDLLGHGSSDHPTDLDEYSITSFAGQLATVCERLELDRPVIGGTSLGANVALELACRHPGVAGGLFVEMPVLEDALLGAALIFTPILAALRVGGRALSVVAEATRRLPRSHYLADILLDWVRRDPKAARAVLEGILFGRTAPPHDERRRIDLPTLVVGHPADPLHPFSDSDLLAAELPDARLVNASSILEWRISPGRLDDELAVFVDDVYADREAPARATPCGT